MDKEIKNYNLLKHDVDENNIVSDLEFEFSHNNIMYYVGAYMLDNENDMYSIHVYKTDCRELSEETEIVNAWLDSCGGGMVEENLDIYDENYNLIEPVTNFIYNKLFVDDDRLIKAF